MNKQNKLQKSKDPQVINMNIDNIDSNIDMILLPGGLDVNPNTYVEAPGFYTSNTDVFKNHFFT